MTEFDPEAALAATDPEALAGLVQWDRANSHNSTANRERVAADQITAALMLEADPSLNLWHALNLARNANPPTTTCSLCSAPTCCGDHELCLARARRGLPTPALSWATECPCLDDRLHPERETARQARAQMGPRPRSHGGGEGQHV